VRIVPQKHYIKLSPIILYLLVTTLALGLRPKKGLARLWAKRKPENEGKCEGMNPHTPKGAATLGVWSLGGLPNL